MIFRYYGPEGVIRWSRGEFEAEIEKKRELLRQQGAPGDRVFIALPPSPDYYLFFLGAQREGMVPVPSLPRHSPQVLEDAAPRIVVRKEGIEILPGRGKEALALVMYTSGSTSDPKAVKITHENLRTNIEQIREALQPTPETQFLNWLPPYHDMGLIGAFLLPLSLGLPIILFDPALFLKDPLFWVELIGKEEGDIIGISPNFGYSYLVKHYDEARLETLDLSHWYRALNGADPIYKKTLDAFVACYGKHKFREGAFFPCYGMAECTLYIAGIPYDPRDTIPISRRAMQNEPPQGEHDTFYAVCSGIPGKGSEVSIRNGEIWVQGPNVTTGEIATGDLGFLVGEKLYVTGRIKDLICLHGRNIYPHDLEEVIRGLSPLLRPGGIAALKVELEAEEGIALAIETEENEPKVLEPLAALLRDALWETHEVAIENIFFLPPKTLSKTTSGKMQRALNQKRLAEGTLPYLYVSALKNRLDPDIPLVRLGYDSFDLIALIGELEKGSGKIIEMGDLPPNPTFRNLKNALKEGKREPSPYQKELYHLNRLLADSRSLLIPISVTFPDDESLQHAIEILPGRVVDDLWDPPYDLDRDPPLRIRVNRAKRTIIAVTHHYFADLVSFVSLFSPFQPILGPKIPSEGVLDFTLDAEEIDALAKKHSVTPFTVLLAGLCRDRGAIGVALAQPGQIAEPKLLLVPSSAPHFLEKVSEELSHLREAPRLLDSKISPEMVVSYIGTLAERVPFQPIGRKRIDTPLFTTLSKENDQYRFFIEYQPDLYDPQELEARIRASFPPPAYLPPKVIAVDCDNTLWEGVVAEDGIEQLLLLPPHKRLQETLREASEKGILVCLVSQNIDRDIVKTFAERPDFPLQLSHIAARAINWDGKEKQLEELSQKLDLPLHTFVLIDDNPVEIGNVQRAHPEILEMYLPTEVTEEDRKRTEFYQQLPSRKDLEVITTIRPVSPRDKKRASQLTLRTTQFNTTGLRLREEEIPENSYMVHCQDRLGDLGDVGFFFIDGEEIPLFLLSCRILGRGVEETVLAFLQTLGKNIYFRFVETERNIPAKKFLEKIGARKAVSSPLPEGLVQEVTSLVERITGQKELDATDNLFTEAAMTSAQLIELLVKIEEQYDVKVTIDPFLDDPTIHRIVSLLEEK